MKDAVSFALPVTPSPNVIPTGELQTEYVGVGEGEGEANEKLPEVEGKKVCTGRSIDPGAAEGYLCLFGKSSVSNTFGGGLVISPVGYAESFWGFEVAGIPATPGPVTAEGVWAVTSG